MKSLLFAIVGFVLVLIGCSATPTQHAANPKDQWINVTNAQNKVVAGVNLADGKIEYYTTPQEAFEVMFGAYKHLIDESQAAQKKAEAAKVDPKKEKKK